MKVSVGLLFAQAKPADEVQPAADAADVKPADANPAEVIPADAKAELKAPVDKAVEGEAGAQVPVKAPAPAPGPNDYLMQFAPFILIAFVFYWLILRPQRTEQSSREAMLKLLKKNDRVLTIGGIIGTVANISDDGKEVTIKIDDNAKMHVVRSSIQSVFVDKRDDPKGMGSISKS